MPLRERVEALLAQAPATFGRAERTLHRTMVDAGHLHRDPAVGVKRAKGEADIHERHRDQGVGGDAQGVLFAPQGQEQQPGRESAAKRREYADFRCV